MCRILPVEWVTAALQVQEHLASLQPHIAISTGMGKDAFEVEQVADDERLTLIDNLGNLPSSPRAVASVKYATALPWPAIERAVVAAGGPIKASRDAGGFICEQVFLALMQVYRRQGTSRRLLRAGFIHVPNDEFVPSVVSRAVVEAAILGRYSSARWRSDEPTVMLLRRRVL